MANNSIKKKSRGNRFLSGFGNEDYLQDFLIGNRTKQSPEAKVSEYSNQFTLEIKAPGCKQEELNLKIEQSILHVYSTIKSGQNRSAHDRSTFHKRFEIPDNIELDNLSATYNDGILKIILPKVMENISDLELKELK